jgi:hypothetical protein
MTDAKEAASAEPSLSPVLQDAINKFNQWSEKHVLLEQEKNTIEMPLYHYTDGRESGENRCPLKCRLLGARAEQMCSVRVLRILDPTRT